MVYLLIFCVFSTEEGEDQLFLVSDCYENAGQLIRGASVEETVVDLRWSPPESVNKMVRMVEESPTCHPPPFCMK